MARSREPLVWSLFAAGGMVAAMLLPVTVVLVGFAVPLGLLSGDSLLAAVRHPLGRLYLFVLVFLAAFHAAHRLRFTLVDVGLRNAGTALGVFLYGGAALLTLAAGWLVVTL